jgi:hypothetical protein
MPRIPRQVGPTSRRISCRAWFLLLTALLHRPLDRRAGPLWPLVRRWLLPDQRCSRSHIERSGTKPVNALGLYPGFLPVVRRLLLIAHLALRAGQLLLESAELHPSLLFVSTPNNKNHHRMNHHASARIQCTNRPRYPSPGSIPRLFANLGNFSEPHPAGNLERKPQPGTQESSFRCNRSAFRTTLVTVAGHLARQSICSALQSEPGYH